MQALEQKHRGLVWTLGPLHMHATQNRAATGRLLHNLTHGTEYMQQARASTMRAPDLTGLSTSCWSSQ